MSDLFNEIIILEALCLREDAHNSLFCLESFLFQYIMKTEAEKKEAKKVYMKAYRLANREKKKVTQKAWNLANKDKVAKHNKTYSEANKETLAIKKKDYREANKDKRRAYIDKNKEKIAKQEKEYKLSNKDKIATQSKARHEANRERNNANSRAYYRANKDNRKDYLETNKDRIGKRGKAYREINRGSIAAQGKVYRESKKLPYNVVYCIPNYDNKGNNYAGVTNRPDIRIKDHKSLGKLNTGNWYELDRIVDRAEAEAKESEYHKLGYHGNVEETRQRNAA